MNLRSTVPELLERDPRVASVGLGGSRGEGRGHALSDWDFLIETDEFASLAADLPELVEPLHPISRQWDRYSSHECYMLMLVGPTKVDLIFPGEAREWSPPWAVSAGTLAAVDDHFWDWILWLEQKHRGGRGEALAAGLHDLYDLLLRPMGAENAPDSVPDAVEAYLHCRDALERRFGVQVPRVLESEVRPVVLRRGPRRA